MRGEPVTKSDEMRRFLRCPGCGLKRLFSPYEGRCDECRSERQGITPPEAEHVGITPGHPMTARPIGREPTATTNGGTIARKQESQFEESQRLCRERDKANRQIVQLRSALEACAADPGESPTIAAESIARLEKSGAW